MSDKPSIVEALAAVMTDVQAVRKSDRNDQQKFNFRGIDAVVNAVGPVLRKHGVVVLPEVLDTSYRDVQTSTGKPSRECTVRVAYTFHGPAGDSLRCVSAGEAMDWGDKGTPKAMSVAFRVALLQALCIPTDEPDPDTQTYERDHTTADPLTALKRQVVRAGQLCGLASVDDLSAKFADLNGGLVLSDATEVELRNFLTWLDEDRKRYNREHKQLVAEVNNTTQAGHTRKDSPDRGRVERVDAVPADDEFYEPAAT